MLAIVDHPQTSLIGERVVNERKRYYYAVADYPNLLLVTMNKPIGHYRVNPETVIVKWDVDDSTITCDVLPDAPQRWRDVVLYKATIMPAWGKKGRPIPLTKVIELKNDEIEGALKWQIL